MHISPFRATTQRTSLQSNACSCNLTNYTSVKMTPGPAVHGHSLWQGFSGAILHEHFAAVCGQSLEWAGSHYKPEGRDAYVALEQLITVHADMIADSVSLGYRPQSPKMLVKGKSTSCFIRSAAPRAELFAVCFVCFNNR